MKENGPPQLILFDGATGAGKSSLLNHLRDEYSGRVLVGAKLTTRQKRISDNDWEFRFVEQIPEQYAAYSFHSVGREYAVDHRAIVDAIDRRLTYAITCVDKRIMGILKSEFDTAIVYVYRSWKTDDLEELLTSRGTADRFDAQLRRDEVASVASQYLEKVELYDHVLLNVGTKKDMIEQLSKILQIYGITPDPMSDRVGGEF